MKVVIVGGVAGGATAAARIRRLDERAEIVVFERSGFVSYANCGLPYYVGGVIEDAAELTLQTPESFLTRFRVQMKVRHEVTAIHPNQKCVTVLNLETGETFDEPYDKLLLAPGARPTVPPIPGIDGAHIYTLRTVEDTLTIRQLLEREKPQSAVVIGGGFIGVEMAENLAHAGLAVTLLEQAPQVLPPFDAELAAFLHAELRQAGIRLLLGAGVTSFASEKKGITVSYAGGSVHADFAVLAIGVTPDTALAKTARLALGQRGAIQVNDRMETSAPDIYAVGDGVEIAHGATGEPAWIALAGPANKQARIAAENIIGRESRYTGAWGSSIVKVAGMTAAATGRNERTLRAAGIDFEKVYLSPASHAGYYPGGKMMTMKVLYEKGTERLLGAQIVGYEGVDKRIDVLATAMQAGMKASALKELDLAYAPPYSSAKDPVNMAGFMIENIENGLLKQWFLEDIETLPRDGSATLLDTRTPGECRRGMLEGFLNIPVDELRERIGELPKGKPVYVICQSGLRSYIACRILAGYGFDAYNFSGGFRLYAAVSSDRKAAEEALPCGMERD